MHLVKNFYPRPPRGGRRLPVFVKFSDFIISIHALREEGDFLGLSVRYDKLISIHALREEGDPITKPCSSKLFVFLSTPSARRATGLGSLCCCGLPISIHALREEGDHKTIQYQPDRKNFYPRPPRGGRPLFQFVSPSAYRISIHALREEGDPFTKEELKVYKKISIHALREEGDRAEVCRPCMRSISIHALREEGDPASVAFAVAVFLFLSTPSARRATSKLP